MDIRAFPPFDGQGTLVDGLQAFDHTGLVPAWSCGSVYQFSGDSPPHHYIAVPIVQFRTILRFDIQKRH